MGALMSIQIKCATAAISTWQYGRDNIREYMLRTLILTIPCPKNCTTKEIKAYIKYSEVVHFNASGQMVAVIVLL